MADNIDWTKYHIYKIGNKIECVDSLEKKQEEYRKIIEPWLCALFQSEHLSLLTGTGLSISVCEKAKSLLPDMKKIEISSKWGKKIDTYSDEMAKKTGRELANIEDQIRTIIDLQKGLEIIGHKDSKELANEINSILKNLMLKILQVEREFKLKIKSDKLPQILLLSFLRSFASRVATRERLHIFTTNYDRFIEYALEEMGVFVIDQFKGQMYSKFDSSRLEIDLHYNPPGIRGEPRYLEGVVRFTKLHGSLDWREIDNEIRRCPLPFGAEESHPEIPEKPFDFLMIYPNSAKGVETSFFPYSELFRDFSTSICRPNSVLVTYGYGFGDSHINRIIKDMLTIPSTHLLIISWDKANNRIQEFCSKYGFDSQISLLIGEHFADIYNLTSYYLPKPSIDVISERKTKILEGRHKITEIEY